MDNNSGVNTILLVVILVVIVGLVVWYFRGGLVGTPAEENSDFNVNVELPNGEGGQGQGRY